MSNTSFCNCCYSNNLNIIKKCNFEHHIICNDSDKQYYNKFKKINCMFCNPFEDKVKVRSRLSDREIKIILLVNIILCIVMMGIMFCLIYSFVYLIGKFDSFFKLYYHSECNILKMQNMNDKELLYCNL